MRFTPSLELPAGGLAKAVEKDLARTNTAAVREGTEALKTDLRDATRTAFGGNRLPMAWRSRVFPKGSDSLNAAGWVEPRRGKGGQLGSANHILALAFEGGVIRAKGGQWLAVPTPEAGRWGVKRSASGFGTTVNSKGARERITPGGFERRSGMKLRFVYDKGGRRAFLIAEQAMLRRGIIAPYQSKGRGSKLYGPGGQSFVAFILVPQVRAKKRMDANAIGQRAAARGTGLVAKHFRG